MICGLHFQPADGRSSQLDSEPEQVQPDLLTCLTVDLQIQDHEHDFCCGTDHTLVQVTAADFVFLIRKGDMDMRIQTAIHCRDGAIQAGDFENAFELL